MELFSGPQGCIKVEISYVVEQIRHRDVGVLTINRLYAMNFDGKSYLAVVLYLASFSRITYQTDHNIDSLNIG